MWLSAIQRISLSVLERNPRKWLARENSYETRRLGKARSQGSEQRGVSASQGKATVRGRQLLKELGHVGPEVGSASARGCQRSW